MNKRGGAHTTWKLTLNRSASAQACWRQQILRLNWKARRSNRRMIAIASVISLHTSVRYFRARARRRP
jgi:hypothetical protein